MKDEHKPKHAKPDPPIVAADSDPVPPEPPPGPPDTEQPPKPDGD